jgi:hypothetical protein
MSRIRQIAITVGASIGLIAVSASTAWAGLKNHCPPVH